MAPTDQTLIEKYHTEITEELRIDDFNVKDIQMRLPAIKHKWVGRWITAKITLSRLKRARTDHLEQIKESMIKEEPVMVSDSFLIRSANRHPDIQKIDAMIDEQELVIDYLEKVEKICSSATYDIKNLIELRKLELT